MARIARDETLLRISKAQKTTIEAWREGVHLETSTGRSIPELRERVVGDRLTLATAFLRDGNALLGQTPPLYRSAISRYYYAMYHAMRAVAYFQHGGDDHEPHQTLPAHTPGDFPQGQIWQNARKDARERRNAADYDPYPKSPAARVWQSSAQAISMDASELLTIVRGYLRRKGCRFL